MSIKKEAGPKEVGSKGGKATLKKYGKKHFVEAGKKRWSKSVKSPKEN